MNKSIMALFGIGIIFVLLLGCVNNPPPQNNTTVMMPAVGLGDTVTADYTLTVDGQVMDTSIASVAQAAGIYTPNRAYVPLVFTAQFGPELIPGFVQGVIGMTRGETKEFVVPPELGYGPSSKEKIITVPRYYQKPLLEEVPRKDAEAQGINVTAGGSYNTKYGTVSIQNYTNDTVTLFYFLQAGAVIDVNGVQQKVITVDKNGTAKIEFMLDQNKTYQLPLGANGTLYNFKVTDKDDEFITLDGNNLLAGKNLTFKVTVQGIVK